MENFKQSLISKETFFQNQKVNRFFFSTPGLVMNNNLKNILNRSTIFNEEFIIVIKVFTKCRPNKNYKISIKIYSMNLEIKIISLILNY